MGPAVLRKVHEGRVDVRGKGRADALVGDVGRDLDGWRALPGREACGELPHHDAQGVYVDCRCEVLPCSAARAAVSIPVYVPYIIQGTSLVTQQARTGSICEVR